MDTGSRCKVTEGGNMGGLTTWNSNLKEVCETQFVVSHWVLKIWGRSGQKCQFWDLINTDPRATGLAG